jgi:hypothetical protein
MRSPLGLAPAHLPESEELARTFVALARGVLEGADTVEVFSMLAESCVRLLPVKAGGILVRDAMGFLQVIGASNQSVHLLDLCQVQNVEGPSLECCRTGSLVADTELSEEGPWPRFAWLATSHGYGAVYAVPLLSRGVPIGALNLFGTSEIPAERLVLAQALADAATLALLQVDPREDTVVLARQVHLAVESRNTVEQARGMIAQRFNVGEESALEQLRRAAERLDLPLVEVARATVHRDGSHPAVALLSQLID